MGATTAELVRFNQINRDAWVRQIAQRLAPGTRVLDVGAGEGRYRALFAHCQYFAQDFGGYQGRAEGVLQEAWHYTGLDYECDATNIPVEAGSFDVVLCTEVLEHVPEPIRVLQEIGRVLRADGQAFISAPLGSGLHQEPYHFYGGFTPYFYRKFLAEAGLEIVRITPNGRFFRLLLQEANRAVGLLKQHHPPWHPSRWLPRLILNGGVIRWLTRLDDEFPVDEFTVGYHVEAVKRAASDA